jgi:hypothetical protein
MFRTGIKKIRETIMEKQTAEKWILYNNNNNNNNIACMQI